MNYSSFLTHCVTPEKRLTQRVIQTESFIGNLAFSLKPGFIFLKTSSATIKSILNCFTELRHATLGL